MDVNSYVNFILVGCVVIGVLLTLKSRRFWIPYLHIIATIWVLAGGFGYSLLFNNESTIGYLFVFVIGQIFWAFLFVFIAQVLSWLVRSLPLRHKQEIGWMFLVGFPLTFSVTIL
ncbi:hypothetical protein [Bacillus sp. SG-1]|uniref:hypothetical protein n=1 Tax=Bacillus sp. SG-1 TaxID=161544 RepID=UPI0001543265|nr:hypothetical protein [Bacillus sp. SG-1]EDL65629.1 hypothetical protein BSG1_12181 [Bacillus sp. SG-1]